MSTTTPTTFVVGERVTWGNPGGERRGRVRDIDSISAWRIIVVPEDAGEPAEFTLRLPSGEYHLRRCAPLQGATRLRSEDAAEVDVYFGAWQDEGDGDLSRTVCFRLSGYSHDACIGRVLLDADGTVWTAFYGEEPEGEPENPTLVQAERFAADEAVRRGKTTLRRLRAMRAEELRIMGAY